MTYLKLFVNSNMYYSSLYALADRNVRAPRVGNDVALLDRRELERCGGFHRILRFTC
jgi:hypothetical protein